MTPQDKYFRLLTVQKIVEDFGPAAVSKESITQEDLSRAKELLDHVIRTARIGALEAE